MNQFTTEGILVVISIVLGLFFLSAVCYFFAIPDATGVSPGMKGLAPLLTRG